MSPKATNSVAGGNATGTGCEDNSDPERVASRKDFDPFRVGTIFLSVPVALPPAIELDACGVKQILLNAKVAIMTIPRRTSSLESIRVTSAIGSECKPLNDF